FGGCTSVPSPRFSDDDSPGGPLGPPRRRPTGNQETFLRWNHASSGIRGFEGPPDQGQTLPDAAMVPPCDNLCVLGSLLAAAGHPIELWPRHVRLMHGVCVFDRRAESNDVAVGVDENSLVLSPLSIFRKRDVGSGRTPRLSQLIGVLDPEIRRTRTRPRIIGYDTEMNLDAITCDEAVPTSVVLPGCEAETPVVFKGETHVAHRKNRRDSLEGSHKAMGVFVHRPAPGASRR